MNQSSPILRFRFERRLALGLIGWLAACFLAASFGAVFMPGEWYVALNKPAWTPPPWIFGPVWTTLYAMMAVAAWLVWKPAGFAARRGPLALFLVQLLLNAAWPPLFFGLHQSGFACAEIVLLWLAIAATRRLSAAQPRRRVAARPLSGVGQLCGGPELRAVAAELLNFRKPNDCPCCNVTPPLLR